jgi:hypothetical protein
MRPVDRTTRQLGSTAAILTAVAIGVAGYFAFAGFGEPVLSPLLDGHADGVARAVPETSAAAAFRGEDSRNARGDDGYGAASSPAVAPTLASSPVLATAPQPDTQTESARMFAAEPALADLIEDAVSSDPRVRDAAQQALEQIDLDQLRETVTPVTR